ncbi:MAG TPA: CU044_2847 family protein, partial [Candidatus Acidoferrum sp.]|nr:CU044_2847 family protein [Candidatus Acidoferrum sp.]
FVEVEIPEAQSRQLAGSFADKVNANIDKIKPILTSVAQPILETWNEINQDMLVEQAEVELGLSFDIEGNVYITKASVAANITIKLVLKPLNNQTSGTP